MAATFLDSLIASHPQHADNFTKLRTLHSRKLWHQLTKELLGLIEDSSFQQGTVLVDLYQKFVSTFADSIQPLGLVRIARAASRRLATPEKSLQFLRDVLKTLTDTSTSKGKVVDQEAVTLCELEIILVRVFQGDVEELRDDLERCKSYIDDFPGIMDALVYASYYNTALEYHRVKGTAAEFYKNSLLYLSYVSFDDLDDSKKVELVSDIGLAALVGTNVYNFGELLTMPTRAMTTEERTKGKEAPPTVISVLDGTKFEWLKRLLLVFNKGDIAGFTSMEEEKDVDKEVFTKNRAFLHQKIRLMALIELVFHRSSDDRTLTFAEISDHCALSENEVELLLMKAFALKVLRGRIDEVEKRVQVTWVQPRVLNKDQISSMKGRMAEWAQRAHNTALFVQASAPDIVKQ